jgi:hypothetical protein
MPTVLLTRYECERNLVPRRCARCGAPADEAVRLTVLEPTTHVLVAALLSLCPPLFVALATILQRRRAMRLPMCPADRADWEWRDRVTSWSYVLAVCVPYVAAVGLVVVSLGHGWEPGVAIAGAGYFAAWACWVTPAALIWTRTVRTTKVAREGIRLSGVSAAFVAGLHTDRAADPDPARRAWFGDVRDDYDDGPG